MVTTKEKTKKIPVEPKKMDVRYIEAVGRRKTATARVRITPHDGKTSIQINNKPLEKYFSLLELRKSVSAPFEKAKTSGSYSVSVKVQGGGIRGQAEAIRHGVARALVKEDSDVRKKLKRAGFLKRDPRAKERRKFGLKKARKAPQWSKR